VVESWFDKFSKHHNVVFTETDFQAYSKMIEEELPLCRKYLREGARILDVGCGLGCGSVPLSTKGYRIVGIDNDPQVIEAAKQNGKNFGGMIEFRLMDAFDIDEEFEEDSFDACMQGGLLEHFSRELIRVLVDKQMHLAPLVISNVPVRTERSLDHFGVEEAENGEKCVDGIRRNLWTEEEWLGDVLSGYTVLESRTSRAIPQIGDFDELTIVLGR
jgi:2-polyprenyl-3-methyl-5-hydroxy-6-metoxy-1,4-benzoquinol methylase